VFDKPVIRNCESECVFAFIPAVRFAMMKKIGGPLFPFFFSPGMVSGKNILDLFAIYVPSSTCVGHVPLLP
jgi:hypothetical protein